MNNIRRNIFIHTKNLQRRFSTINQSAFGILYDIDGVIVQGSHAVEGASKMFEMINKSYKNKIPIVYFTNSCDDPENKASFLNSIFNINIDKNHIIHAPAPLKLFKDIHNKRTLFVGQGNVRKTAESLCFTNVVELSDVQKAFPTLDVVDKIKRNALKSGYVETKMDPIESIIILGEPTDWQSYLQILIDLLVTGGNLSGSTRVSQQLPIYLCNLDFLYKAESDMLRFGNGAFIHCLEALYKKFTGNDLKYSAVIGKPGEISYQYAEHVLSSINQHMNGQSMLKRIYMIGDNQTSDILGANLYQHFIEQPSALPSYRTIPGTIDTFPRSVTSIKSFLVKTGVYTESNLICNRHIHWTFSSIDEACLTPTMIVDDCLEAFYRILEIEMLRGNH